MYSGILQTPRLELRLLNLDDSDQTDNVVRTYNDPYIGPWGFTAVGINGVDDLRAKCQKHAAKPELCTRLQPGQPPPSIIHLVYLRTTGEYIGLVGVSFRNERPYPDLGYAFFEPFNGQGYATEAGREVLRFWREDIGVEDIFVATLDSNVRSQSLARRIGFVDGGPLVLDLGTGESVTGWALVLPHMTWPDGGIQITPNLRKAEDRSHN